MTGPFTTVTTKQWERLQDIFIAAEYLLSLRGGPENEYVDAMDLLEVAVEKAQELMRKG